MHLGNSLYICYLCSSTLQEHTVFRPFSKIFSKPVFVKVQSVGYARSEGVMRASATCHWNLRGAARTYARESDAPSIDVGVILTDDCPDSSRLSKRSNPVPAIPTQQHVSKSFTEITVKYHVNGWVYRAVCVTQKVAHEQERGWRTTGEVFLIKERDKLGDVHGQPAQGEESDDCQ